MTSARKALDNLADALIEDIMALSDEEVLEELRESGVDPERHAAEMRAIFEKAVAIAKERRVIRSLAPTAAPGQEHEA